MMGETGMPEGTPAGLLLVSIVRARCGGWIVKVTIRRHRDAFGVRGILYSRHRLGETNQFRFFVTHRVYLLSVKLCSVEQSFLP